PVVMVGQFPPTTRPGGVIVGARAADSNSDESVGRRPSPIIALAISASKASSPMNTARMWCFLASSSVFRGLRSRVAALAEHLLDVGDVELLAANHLPRELFEGDAPSLDEMQQLRVELDALSLVHEHLLHHLVDAVVMRAYELADSERHARAHRGHLLADCGGVRKVLRRLRSHPLHDRDTCVPEHHERVLRVSHR